MTEPARFLRAAPYSGELVPSQLGLTLVEHYFGLDEVMHLAQSGSHNLNPYHNLVHELQHVFWSNACAANSNGPGEDECAHRDLALASLFHDHNHSGGARLDSVNILRAVEFVKVHFPTVTLKACDVIGLIEVTEFLDGKWTHEPKTFEEKCMRDADLMSIYTREGRRLLVGLMEELGTPITHHMKKDEITDLLFRHAEFLWKAEMFTSFGKQIKADHLERSLKDFERIVWNRYRYEVSGHADADD
jgi:hypothetical protein